LLEAAAYQSITAIAPKKPSGVVMLSPHKRGGNQAPKMPARMILERPLFGIPPERQLKKQKPTAQKFLGGKKLEKQNADICRCGRKIHAGIAT
jgi:hypothetical protein